VPTSVVESPITNSAGTSGAGRGGGGDGEAAAAVEAAELCGLLGSVNKN
jgi:hypothetical protein